VKTKTSDVNLKILKFSNPPMAETDRSEIFF
jgi:hypothetical protein